MTERPPLKALHDTLISLKVEIFQKLTTAELVKSLDPGQEHCLKTRADGTILDGHHRIHVLRTKGEDVDALPQEVIVRDDE